MRRIGDRRPAGPRIDQASPAKPQKTKTPSLARQAKNLAAAVTAHVVDGLKHVDDETFAARLAICDGCDSLDAQKQRCNECGCRVAKKARWRTSTCPLEKWPAPPVND